MRVRTRKLSPRSTKRFSPDAQPNSSRAAMPDSCSRRLRASRARTVVALVLAALVLSPARLSAATTPVACLPQPRPQDEIWLVSSRGFCSCDVEQNAEQLAYWQFDRERSWMPASAVDFFATDDAGTVTVVFLHGNRIPSGEAFTKGWIAYRRLVRCADERPVRFVIWSWPSDKVCGPVQDARIKAARSDAHGYYLAGFITQIRPDVPVGLWGHSFGARIATGALHLLGGGTLVGHRLEAAAGRPHRPMHAALVVAALDDEWLLPGHRQGHALSQVDAMLLVNNSCDRLLKRYHKLYGRRCCQEALGYVGLAECCLSPGDAEKVQQVDACCYAGKQHLFANYIDSPALMSQMRSHLLFDMEAATMTPEAVKP
jgi:hypothetical protein